ncbi:hypothetical protein [uncultured Parasutterella sp.]|uniref:hypothetical protein n=1 Tax=uncultured Parasutterella sp. TaxID=1263098 RepID=UPI0025B676B9|nr:hypothetical protein [uncultured Parasutterella sp.]
MTPAQVERNKNRYNNEILKNHLLLDKHQLAEFFGVSLKTISRWTKDGILPAPGRGFRQEKLWRARDIKAIVDRLGTPV